MTAPSLRPADYDVTDDEVEANVQPTVEPAA